MATAAVDWQPIVEGIKASLETDVPNVGGLDVYYDAGKFDLTVDYMPACTIWLGGSTFETIRLGKESGRLAYRESKQIFLLCMVYKAGMEDEDSIWLNAHGQCEDLLRLILNAITTDTTIGGLVMTSRLVEVVKNPPEQPEDEQFQAARIELIATKSWFA